MNPDTHAAVQERLALAKKPRGGVAWETNGLFFKVRPCPGPTSFFFENADVRGLYQADAQEGWTVTLTVEWLYLATHSFADTVSMLRRVAHALGVLVDERVRRVDLAADWQGFVLGEDNGRCMVGKRKTRSVDYVRLEERAADRRYWTEERLTGLTVCEGNPLMLRIYSKTLELSLTGREHKREIETALWMKENWDGSEVFRTEFQLRGEVLDQLTMRSLKDLEDRLDPAWQYCTKKWIRLVIAGTHSRRKNCDIDPRWLAVQHVVFHHKTQPATRIYRRGGADEDMASGVGMSLLAAMGILERVRCAIDPETGTVLDEYSSALALDESTARHRLRRKIQRNKLLEAEAIFSHLLKKCGGPREALGRYNLKQNAAAARCFSVDEERWKLDSTLQRPAAAVA